jgi:hypothetical protein
MEQIATLCIEDEPERGNMARGHAAHPVEHTSAAYRHEADERH